MDEKNNKLLYVIIAFFAIFALIYLIISTKNMVGSFNKKNEPQPQPEEVITEDNIKENMYIGIWRELSGTDIALYSRGEDDYYLGSQPYQYIITKKGNVYEYQDKMFTKDKPIFVHLKKLSDDELKEIENELKTIFENYNSSDENEEIEKGTGWIIHYNDSEIRVRRDVLNLIFEKYFAGIEIKVGY